MVLRNRQLEIHAQRVAIELDRFLGILATIGDVMDAFQMCG